MRTPDDLRRASGRSSRATTVALALRRDGDDRRSARCCDDGRVSRQDPGRAIIGVRVAQAADIELPLKVEIDLGDVGGPSAGLPFALDVLQKLGRDVDRGHTVAATGEIELDGTVAPDRRHRAEDARREEAGVDVFLVPAGDNAAEARRYAGDLRVIAGGELSTGVASTGNTSRKVVCRTFGWSRE